MKKLGGVSVIRTNEYTSPSCLYIGGGGADPENTDADNIRLLIRQVTAKPHEYQMLPELDAIRTHYIPAEDLHVGVAFQTILIRKLWKAELYKRDL